MRGLHFGERPARFYNCPICGKDVPVWNPKPQAYGLVRSNHLRSHGLWTSSMTLEQKNDRQYLVALWKSVRLSDTIEAESSDELPKGDDRNNVED